MGDPFPSRTQHNRKVRMVNLKKINFPKENIVRIVLDRKKEQEIEDVTPK